MPASSTILEVESRINSHEAVCNERNKAILDTLQRIDHRTEQHSASIQELKQKASQHSGAWKTMIAVAILLSILIKLKGLNL